MKDSSHTSSVVPTLTVPCPLQLTLLFCAIAAHSWNSLKEMAQHSDYRWMDIPLRLFCRGQWWVPGYVTQNISLTVCPSASSHPASVSLCFGFVHVYLWMIWFLQSVAVSWYTVGNEFTSHWQLGQISFSYFFYWSLEFPLLCHSEFLERAVVTLLPHVLPWGSSFLVFGKSATK